jgi:hypothetical protein
MTSYAQYVIYENFGIGTQLNFFKKLYGNWAATVLHL